MRFRGRLHLITSLLAQQRDQYCQANRKFPRSFEPGQISLLLFIVAGPGGLEEGVGGGGREGPLGQGEARQISVFEGTQGAAEEEQVRYTEESLLHLR